MVNVQKQLKHEDKINDRKLKVITYTISAVAKIQFASDANPTHNSHIYR